MFASMPGSGPKARNWCLTIFLQDAQEDVAVALEYFFAAGCTWEEYARLAHWDDIADAQDIKYLCFQTERAPESGRLHLQAYVQFGHPVRMTGVKKCFGSSVHCEVQRGTVHEAIDYCKKPESRVFGPFEFGVPSNMVEGRARDMENALAMARAGASASEIRGAFPNLYRVYRAVDAMVSDVARTRPKVPGVILFIYGPTGCGKTAVVVSACDMLNERLFMKSPDTVWWDLYSGEKVVAVDEFGPENGLSYREINSICGDARSAGQIKGSHVPVTAHILILISNYSLDSILDQWCPVQADTIRRRVVGTYCALTPKTWTYTSGAVQAGVPGPAPISVTSTRGIRDHVQSTIAAQANRGPTQFVWNDEVDE